MALAPQAKVLALIPARGGSKRFKRKNLALLNGKPLVQWTIESALASGAFAKVVLSSDDEEILALGQAFAAQGLSLHPRQADLAQDQVTAAQVMQHLLQDLASAGEVYDQCCLLLPTCPFRGVEDIHQCQALLTPQVDAVISMRESPVIAEFLFTADSQHRAQRVFNSASDLSQTRKQDHQTTYYPNGAIYWAWVGAFMQQGRFYSERFAIYAMPEYRSVDIDIEEDLVYAHAIWARFIAPSSSPQEKTP